MKDIFLILIGVGLGLVSMFLCMWIYVTFFYRGGPT